MSGLDPSAQMAPIPTLPQVEPLSSNLEEKGKSGGRKGKPTAPMVHKFRVGDRFVLRGKREPLTAEQKAKLESAFQSGRIPLGRVGREAKNELADQIGLSYKRVHKWFDNRRIKESKINQAAMEMMRVNQSENALDSNKKRSRSSDQDPDAGQDLADNQHENTIDTVEKSPKRSKKSFYKETTELIKQKLEKNNLTFSAPTPTKQVQGEKKLNNIDNAFEVVRAYLDGRNDLQAIFKSDAGEEIGTGLESKSNTPGTSRRTSKQLMAPSLANVLDHIFEAGSMVHPLSLALDIIARNGAVDLLRAMIQPKEKNFRTFLLLFKMGKISGNPLSQAFVRSMMHGIGASFSQIDVLPQLKSYFPELLAPANSPNFISAHRVYLFRQEGLESWASAFLKNEFRERSVVVLDSQTQGRIVDVLAPTPGSHTPNFKVSIGNNGNDEEERILRLDEIKIYHKI